MKLSLMVASLLLVSGSAFAKGPCKKDVETLCPTAKHQREIMKCMTDNKDKLSAECQAMREERKEVREDRKEARKEQREAMVEACSADMEKLCGDIKGGRGRKMKCMHEKMDQVSAPCKAELEKAPIKKGFDKKKN